MRGRRARVRGRRWLVAWPDGARVQCRAAAVATYQAAARWPAGVASVTEVAPAAAAADVADVHGVTVAALAAEAEVDQAQLRRYLAILSIKRIAAAALLSAWAGDRAAVRRAGPMAWEAWKAAGAPATYPAGAAESWAADAAAAGGFAAQAWARVADGGPVDDLAAVAGSCGACQ